jgi:hypothetical protein
MTDTTDPAETTTTMTGIAEIAAVTIGTGAGTGAETGAGTGVEIAMMIGTATDVGMIEIEGTATVMIDETTVTATTAETIAGSLHLMMLSSRCSPTHLAAQSATTGTGETAMMTAIMIAETETADLDSPSGRSRL